MARKQNRKHSLIPQIKRMVGIVVALFVLFGAVIGALESAMFSLHADAEENPKLAHYVNRMGEAINGNVHIDLETGKETFSVDLQAYIPADAEKLVITEPLNPVFCFVNAETQYRWQFRESGDMGNHPPLAGDGFLIEKYAPVVKVDRTTSVGETLTATLDLSAMTEEEKAQVRGSWLQLGFDVRVNDSHSYDEGILDYVFSTYENAAPIPKNEPVMDAPTGAHNGLNIQANYIVEKGTEGVMPVYSNIVTVARLKAEEPAEATVETTQPETGQAESNTGSAEAAESAPLTRSVTLTQPKATVNSMQPVSSTEGTTQKSAVSSTEGTTTTGAGAGNGTTEEETTRSATKMSSSGTSGDTSAESSAGSTEASVPENTQAQNTVTLEGLIAFQDVPEGERPESITITVFADNEERISFALNGGKVATVIGSRIGPGCTVEPTAVGDAWGFTITNLDEKKEDGTDIVYTIRETGRPDGYLVTYAGGADYADAANSYVIINSYSESQAAEDKKNAGEAREEEEEETTALGKVSVDLYLNGEAKDAVLKQRDDTFTYTIEATVPEGAKTFKLTDTLDPVLKLYSQTGDIKVTANGVTVPQEGDMGGETQKTVTVDGQVLTVRIPDAETREGERISVRFDAIVRSDMEASSLAANGGEIPNSVKAEATDASSQTATATSATRYVKLPEEAGVKKIVNNEENYVLENAGDELNYTITARIPLDAVTYTMVDSVSQVIEVKSASAEVGGKAVTASALSTRGQEVSLKLDDAYNYAGETVTMKVNAKIVQGADLSLFNNYKIPNTVTIFVNGKLYETSEPATVDGSVLGVRRNRVRGGRTGDTKLFVNIGVGIAALIALVMLLRKRVDF